MDKIFNQLSDIGIVPVIKIDAIETALPLARALCEGGLPCAEITFRTEQAEEAIRIISRELPQMIVGAGTVLTTKQADTAVAAGAKFIVSPGLNPNIVKYCQKLGVPIIPGTANASDIEAALELGLDIVKFFPAEVNGGIKAIKALAAPYVGVKFMPTGGVSESNLNEYLSFEKIIACGGSWMVDSALIAAGNFEAIKALTEGAVRKMLGFKLKHIGINAANEGEAMQSAKLFGAMLGMGSSEPAGGASVFVGDIIEVMKRPGRGKNGHIAIGTNSVQRAVSYLERKGFVFDGGTKKFDANGRLSFIYFKDEIAGFAVHLVPAGK